MEVREREREREREGERESIIQREMDSFILHRHVVY